ncbi:ribonuclease H-like domain-containing protein [Tanacetum coccineum]
MAFVSSPSSTNEVNTAYGVSATNTQVSHASTQVSTASTQVSTTNLSDDTVYAFLASQPNGSQLVYEDLEQIHEDELEEMDLKWQLALLSMRTRRFFQKTGRKITINGSDTAGYDKSKVECFNCHKMGHFARECRGPRNQDSRNRNQDSSRRTVNVEETSSKAMVAIDGAGFDWSYMADDEVPTNMALMAFSDSEVHNDKTCSKTYLKSFETLKTQLDDLRIEFNKSDFSLATYKRGLASVEEQLVFYKKNEVIFCEQLAVLKRDISYKDSEISMLKSELEKLKQEKESNQLKIEKFDNDSKSLEKLIGSQIPDKSRKGVGFASYNVVPPLPAGLFSPPKFDLSNFGLEEFQQPEFEGYGPKTSKSVSENFSKEVRESPDTPLVKKLVSDDKLEKKTGSPTVTKIEFIRPKQQEKLVRKPVKYSKIYRPKAVNTTRPNSVVANAVRANQVNAVKASTCNMSYLSDFKEFDRGYVTFGGGAKGGKITGKGTLKIGINLLLLVKLMMPSITYYCWATAGSVNAVRLNLVPLVQVNAIEGDFINTSIEGFIQSLNRFQSLYALTVNPTIYTSCIKQFWATAKAKTINGEVQIQALVDGKKVIVIETSYIFDNIVKNLEGGVKFLMYPRFVQVLLDKQDEGMTKHKEIYVTPSHTKKVFANMKREGKGFSRRVTPLFQTRMVQALKELGKGSEIPTDPQHIPTIIQPSTSQPQKKQPRRKQRKDIEVPQPSGSIEPITNEAANKKHVSIHSNDSLLNSEDRLKLNELMELCTNLSQKVLDLENTKTSQAVEIAKLKERVKKLERRNKSRTPGLKRLRKVGRTARIESSEDEGLGAQEDASKQGRKIADLDANAEEVKVEKVVSTAEVTIVSATTTTVDELTLAQTLIEIKATKPKAVTTAATTTITDVTRPKARGVVVQELSEFTKITSPSQLSQFPQAKDKGKAKMIEPEKPLKKKDQILIDEEIPQKLQAQLNVELEEEEKKMQNKEKKMQTLLNGIMFKL